MYSTARDTSHCVGARWAHAGLFSLLIFSAAAQAAAMQRPPPPPPPVIAPTTPALGGAIEQRAQGSRPALEALASFDGLGIGFAGAAPPQPVRNPSDNALAVGPDHIFQIVNTRYAIFTKKGARYDTTGRVLVGSAPTNAFFQGVGGQCEARNNGDAVVKYDQLADRWLVVMPIFRRPANDSTGPYSMCYAVSVGPDPLGPYYKYEFLRPLFPDYPRIAVWPDGYYNGTSTGDDVIEKHFCVADRARMLQGLSATEQCHIVNDVNFPNPADIDGMQVPPPGAPAIVLATGGTQLKGDFDDDGIYYWLHRVNWADSTKSRLEGPFKIPVAPYNYLCNGQLTNCVPQPDSARRLDAQGDKLMNRVVYRRIGSQESIVATHSVNTTQSGGGVRWYEFRLGADRRPRLFQQGTFAPDSAFRWMASIGMDARGNIGFGFSYGSRAAYVGQRFAARLATDPPGTMGFRESVLQEGAGAQGHTNRWEDYPALAIDPSDDCTFWYVGDYLKRGAATYSTRIGAYKVPGCGAAVGR
ncbi:MAG: hypothetical protein FJ202_06405 [Gemmatimonadetes bacterium]|nr:hypothetical protein [Gemmatimonadota bacterium]